MTSSDERSVNEDLDQKPVVGIEVLDDDAVQSDGGCQSRKRKRLENDCEIGGVDEATSSQLCSTDVEQRDEIKKRNLIKQQILHVCLVDYWSLKLIIWFAQVYTFDRVAE